jgi:catechol 2,3-dioxygenase-like lactoylglutathione lyase family enzyme
MPATSQSTVPAPGTAHGHAGQSEPAEPSMGEPVFHHIAVQTADFDGSIAWYQEFFGCKLAWTLREFSELTRSRLPGIAELAELIAGPTRFHVFTCGADMDQPPPRDTQQFQHLCVSTCSSDALAAWRDRWLDIFRSGRYSFAIPDTATDIVTDADGVQSFYCYDINGLEYEFTYIPVSTR